MAFIQIPSVEEACFCEHDEKGRASIEAQDVILIHHIARLLRDADDAVNSLSLNARNALLDFHVENHQVPHCTRWGSDAAEDAVQAISTEEL